MENNEYEKLSNDTISDMRKKLRYWYEEEDKKDERKEDKVESEGDEKIENEVEGKKKIIETSTGGFACEKGFRNLYLKGYVYFSTSSFLLAVIGPQVPEIERSKMSFFEKFNLHIGNKDPLQAIYSSLEEKYREYSYVYDKENNEYGAHFLFNLNTLKNFNWEVRKLCEFKKDLTMNHIIYDQMQAHLYHLALEYLFKAIEFHTRGKITPTHDLDKIFSNFSPKLQLEIEREVERKADDKLCLLKFKKGLKLYGNLDVTQNRFLDNEKHFSVHVPNVLTILALNLFCYIFPIEEIFNKESDKPFTNIRNQ